jgi:hypothetical protein
MHDANGKPKVNSFLWQHFVNYNFGKGWALATTPSITADLTARDGQSGPYPSAEASAAPSSSIASP